MSTRGQIRTVDSLLDKAYVLTVDGEAAGVFFELDDAMSVGMGEVWIPRERIGPRSWEAMNGPERYVITELHYEAIHLGEKL